MLQQKHSRTLGAFPNLIPGEIGHNLADDLLWVRVAGRRVALPLADYRTSSVPAIGPYGAPLGFGSPRPQWVSELAPSSTVDGVVPVDLPPVDAYGVPGFHIFQQGGTVALAPDTLRIERFYVASSSVHLSALSFLIVSMPSGLVRVGIAASDGTVLIDENILVPSEGANEIAVDLTLPRGAYYALLWTAEGLSIGSVQGYRPEQGWEINEDDEPVFLASESAVADLSSSLSLDSLIIEQQELLTPGEIKTVLMQWDIPPA
jgi:hypothetical protein